MKCLLRMVWLLPPPSTVLTWARFSRESLWGLLQRETRAVPLWEQNPKDHANTRGNKRAQDPGPPKAPPTRKSQRPTSAGWGSSVRAIPGRDTNASISNGWKIAGWGLKKETGSTEHAEEGLQSRFRFRRNNHVPIGERTSLTHSMNSPLRDTW